MRWERGRYALEMMDEPAYSFGSADNPRSYAHEYLFDSAYRPSSMHGLACFEARQARSSAILGASGGGTGVHGRSCVLLQDRCFVAVGDRVASLALPELALVWQAKVDEATCFGLHLTPDEEHLVVHGELEISKLTLDGRRAWAFSGRDIFTGECAIRGNTVVVEDFDGRRYSIDLERGVENMAGASQ